MLGYTPLGLGLDIPWARAWTPPWAWAWTSPGSGPGHPLGMGLDTPQGLGLGTPLWTEFLTHACENITFPQLHLRTVIIKYIYLMLYRRLIKI